MNIVKRRTEITFWYFIICWGLLSVLEVAPYIVTYYIKWVTTSCTHSIHEACESVDSYQLVQCVNDIPISFGPKELHLFSKMEKLHMVQLVYGYNNMCLDLVVSPCAPVLYPVSEDYFAGIELCRPKRIANQTFHYFEILKNVQVWVARRFFE